ncbi:MAG: response regulator [Chthoniobacteraceae bacterium]
MFSGLHILLVEDHADSALLMCRFLARLGCEVVHAGDVQSALASAREKLPGLVMTDLSLPDGDGISLIRAIRELGPVPAMAISGHPMEEHWGEVFQHHFIKPLDWKALESTLESFRREMEPVEK